MYAISVCSIEYVVVLYDMQFGPFLASKDACLGWVHSGVITQLETYIARREVLDNFLREAGGS